MGSTKFDSANEFIAVKQAHTFYGSAAEGETIVLWDKSASGIVADAGVDAIHLAFDSSEITVSLDPNTLEVVLKSGETELARMVPQTDGTQITCANGTFYAHIGLDETGNAVLGVSPTADPNGSSYAPAGEEYTPVAEDVDINVKSESPAVTPSAPDAPADPVDMTLAEAVTAGELTAPYNLVVDEDKDGNAIVPNFSVEEAALVKGIVEGAENAADVPTSNAADYTLVDSVENLTNASKPVFDGATDVVAKDSITEFVNADGEFEGVPTGELIVDPSGYEVLGEAAGENFRLNFDGTEGNTWDGSDTYRVLLNNIKSIAGGDGADFFSVNPTTDNWGGASVDKLLIFTGAATEAVDGKYEAGADSITKAAEWQERFETNIKAESTSPTPSDADFAHYDNANVVTLGESVTAATIVTSTAKDVIEFNYQLGQDAKIEIHGFEFGTDLLVVRNYYDNGDYFSFNMKDLGTNEGVSIARGEDSSEAFVTINFEDLIPALTTGDSATTTNATIKLVGLQGYDFNTNDVGELFGVGIAADAPAA